MIEITEQFATTNNGYLSGVNEFNARLCDNPSSDKFGKWITSSNTPNDFPELFEGISTGNEEPLSDTNFPIIHVTPEDFLQTDK